ncbi:nucleoside triphosphate pyrophosphatase [Acetobacter malorum]|uniref:Nucleoside triphosphate pyrophosphatase n=1 Tax=Acetobacter malorum TaxID=178901 RepID=A0A1Y3GAR3_9PROT|nr:Maf family protein [Acetobacter malorum]OUJ05576.1 semialdehyde dehydrogenase [Acetobacter malorum]
MSDLVLKPTPIQDSRHKLVLASGSAIRRKLLENAGLTFSVLSSSVDEEPLKKAGRAEGAPPETVALRLAEAKALSVSCADAFVIGADQMLSCKGDWYDKPADLTAARQQLLSLRGQTHTLHTAVVVCRNGQVLWQHVSEPQLTMRLFSDAFLEAYLAEEGDECLYSVGAYRIEGPGLHLFARMEGDQTAILGLPLLPLLEALREMGVLFS